MRKELRNIVMSLTSLSIVLALTACGSSDKTPAGTTAAAGAQAQSAASQTEAAAPAATDTPVKLRLSSNVSSKELEENKTAMAKGVNNWIQTVEEASGGSITVELFPDAQLASSTEQIVTGVTGGAFEVAHFATGNWNEYSNAFSELNVPYLYLNYDVVHQIMDSEIGTGMMAQLEKDVAGVKPLAFIDIGFRHVTNSKREIKTPDDMKGLKIRTMNDPIQMAAMEALGASVTTISVSELFGALQQKMVDAQENPLSTINSQKFYEVQPYCTLTRHSFTSTFMFMNMDAYNKLSDAQKEAVDKANKACTEGSREVVEAVEQEYKQVLIDNGMQIYEPAEAELAVFRDKAKASWDIAVKSMGDDRYNALMDKVDQIEKELGLQ